MLYILEDKPRKFIKVGKTHDWTTFEKRLKCINRDNGAMYATRSTHHTPPGGADVIEKWVHHKLRDYHVPDPLLHSGKGDTETYQNITANSIGKFVLEAIDFYDNELE